MRTYGEERKKAQLLLICARTEDLSTDFFYQEERKSISIFEFDDQSKAEGHGKVPRVMQAEAELVKRKAIGVAMIGQFGIVGS